MKIALCNEVLQPMAFAQQCVHAKALGYDGLELAPFTISDTPHQLSRAEIVATRRAASDAGIAITGLHWLLVRPAGLSITSADGAVRSQTVDVMRALIDLCAELGGSYLVHGSPAQRRTPPGDTKDAALARATECWARAGEYARSTGVTYCIEPLSRDLTDLVNTVAEAAALVDKIGNRALRTMIDTCSAGLAETEALPAIITRYVGSGHIAHVQVNDRNRRGPGEGNDTFAPIFKALRESRYAGVVAAEPFVYEPDGRACAARSIGYIKGILEALQV
ncbi:MAG: sugar phosphate isomerase/epimerase family protein [Burkholderiales bacterium]